MKIVFRNVLVLLSFIAYNYFCLAKDNIKIGAFFDQTQESNPINWNVIEDGLVEGTEYEDPETFFIAENDEYATTNNLCNAAASNIGFSAIFGPRNPSDSVVIESICSFFRTPYIITYWRPMNSKEKQSTFNLFPDADTFSKGLATIVKSLDWKQFVVIYEDADSLAKLQDVLKLQTYKEGYDKNNILVKKLNEGLDQRSLLKDIAASSIRKIIVDCQVHKIPDILNQARKVHLLADLSTSFFFSSLDAHTIDYSKFEIGANITTIRLFDPANETFQRVVSQYYPTVPPEYIQVETALQHDAMLLFTEAVNSLKTENPNMDLSPKVKFCNNSDGYFDHINLIQQMHTVVVQNGLTGAIKLEYGKRDRFTMEVIEIHQPNRPIGIWNSETPFEIHLTRNATEREAELQRRLSNHNFKVSSKIGQPYLMETFEPGAIGNTRYKGYAMDLMTEIAKEINITFEFVVTTKTQYIMEDLISRRADLGICDFTITHQRRELIDFSMPFMSLGISILHKETDQEELDNMYAFMRPFSWTVWLYIVTLYLVLSLVTVVIARLDPDDWENPHPCNQNPEELENIWGIKNCLWLSLGSIMTQGCDILPKGICSRIATAMWWFFSLIMTSTYTANLAAFLTMQKQEDTIDTVEELANQNKIKYGVMKDGSTQDFFQFSNNSLYQKMWATMKNENPSVFEETNDKGVDRVVSTKNGLYAFLMESTQIEYELEKECKLKKIGQFLDSKSYGIGMPLGASYRHNIDNAVLKLQQSGRLFQIKELWWKKNLEGDRCERNEEETNTDQLTLANVGGVFVVLGTGIGLAFAFAISEFLWNVHSISVEEHMTYFEAFKCEVKFAANIFIRKKRAKPVISESSSSNADDDNRSIARTILAGAGSFLNINASVLSRMGQNAFKD